MNLTTYLYDDDSPPGGAELRLADGARLEVRLYPGRLVELPADHDYTRTLLALKLLRASAGSEPPAPAETSRRSKPNNKETAE
ncbi:TPA: hypothetical protein L6B33_24215 [Pseudomonas aeruginosa]|uniref:hypothetical protein n=1 Tax=Pseudomonas aeruginosa TaxID=287 RepID=UPI00093756BF|nr:hypothetical protein [Pseudomonas aeruginosa]RCM51497.1 hypothetical protein PA82_03388 [Pseudomonas aeruginosa]HBP5712254.1 hypothetical protein [Pseudomonas aeruginosa]HCT4763217.1 hypothetical protein [Pseudomonas aeruginosa]HDZ6692585.1 hypothetical protein [Pseudomonas aeruginosa]